MATSGWATLSSRPVARRPTPPPAAEPPRESSPTPNQPNSVTLGPRDRVIGQIYIEGDLRVSGTVEGEIEVSGDLEIEDMAKVKASLAGRDVSIRGQVNGAIVARKRLIVARSGSLIGDVHVARLVIQDGATFSGKVSMGAAAQAPAKATETKPVVPEPKPVVPTPGVEAVAQSSGPIVPGPIVQAPINATMAPSPAAKAAIVPVRTDRKATKKDALPPKDKPKRR